MTNDEKVKMMISNRIIALKEVIPPKEPENGLDSRLFEL